MGIAHLLNRRVTLERKTRTADSQGGFAETYADVGTMPARIHAPSAADREVGARLEAVVSQVAYVTGGFDVQRDDRLVLGVGRYAYVVAVLDPSRPGHHRKLLLDERQRGA